MDSHAGLLGYGPVLFKPLPLRSYRGGESGYRLWTRDRVSLEESSSKPGGTSSKQLDLSSPAEPP